MRFKGKLNILIHVLVVGMTLPLVLYAIIMEKTRGVRIALKVLFNRIFKKEKPKSYIPFEHCKFWGVPCEGGIKNLVDGKVYPVQQGGTAIEINLDGKDDKCFTDQVIKEALDE